MFGYVRYIQRSEYADREAMLSKHAVEIAGTTGSILWPGSSSKRLAQEPKVERSSDVSGITASTETSPFPSTKKVAVIKEGAGDAFALLGESLDLCP